MLAKPSKLLKQIKKPSNPRSWRQRTVYITALEDLCRAHELSIDALIMGRQFLDTPPETFTPEEVETLKALAAVFVGNQKD